MRAPVISLASTKGGVGKTTLAFVLATEFARRGREEGSNAPPVVCIDGDPNATLIWAVNRGRPDGVEAVPANDDTIMAVMNKAVERGRAVVVDLQGSANQAMLYAVAKSNLVLIPTQPSAFDMRQTIGTEEVVRKAADMLGRKIEARIVFSRTAVLPRQVTKHSQDQVSDRSLAKLKVEMMERTALQKMTFTGKPPVADNPTSAAAKNVAALADEVASIIGLPLEGQGAA
jgi:chromosome partitioning protein